MLDILLSAAISGGCEIQISIIFFIRVCLLKIDFLKEVKKKVNSMVNDKQPPREATGSFLILGCTAKEHSPAPRTEVGPRDRT